MTRALLLAAVVLGASPSTAQAHHDLEVGAATVAVAGTGKAGTHENALGAFVGARVRLPLGLRVRSGLEVEALVQDLGIQELSAGAQAVLEVGYYKGGVGLEVGPGSEPAASRPAA